MKSDNFDSRVKVSDDIQHKIASLIQKAHKARKKARDLLGEAKRKVEEVIEEES